MLGDRLPTRGEITSGRLPVAVRPRNRLVPVLVGVPAVIFLLFWFDGLFRFGLIHSMVLALLMLSLVVLVGFAGQISLGQAALAGVAGFSLARFGDGLDIPFPLAPVLAVAVATVIGLVVGLPALRIRGVQLAVVTIAGAVAIEEILFKNESFTGGIKGSTVAPPELLGVDLSVSGGGTFPRIAFGIFVLLVLTAVSLAVVNLRLGSTGFRLLAVRSNERAAAALGVNVSATKLLAFGLSSFIAAIGGVMLGYERQQLSFGSFDVFVGITILAFAYLGGIASVSGALVGAALVSGGFVATALEEWIGFPAEYQLLVGGLGLCVTAVLNPEGISGGIRLAREQAAAKKAAKRADTGAATPPDADRPTPAGTPPDAEPRPRTAGPPLLTVTGLSVVYGGVRALHSFDFMVRSGTLTGLIGPNGAGKTTCIDALTGFVEHSTGQVCFDGTSLDGMPPHARARHGLVRTFQAVELFDELTVAENLAVAADQPRWWTPAADLVWPTRDTGAQPAIDRALELLDIDELAGRYPGELSNGQRRLVGVARALAAEPKLVLLDEPAAGLDSAESLDLGRRLQRLVDHGVTILLIDHDMSLVLNVCDELYVLDFGHCIASGSPEEISRDEAVIAAYLGTDDEVTEVSG